MINSKNNEIFKNMQKLFYPLLFSNLLNSLLYIINIFWAGRLIGETGASIIANSFSITIFIASISAGFMTAVSVIVAQNYGEKDDDKLKKNIGYSYFMAILIAVLISVITFLILPLFLMVLNTPIDIVNDMKGYVFIFLLSTPFNFLFLTITTALKSTNDTKTPLKLMIVAVILNFLIIPVLITLGFGIIGIAITNLLVKIILMMLAILYVNKHSLLLKLDSKYLKFNNKYLKDVIKIGGPITIEVLLIAILIVFETYIANKTGVSGSAALGVVGGFEEIVVVIGDAILVVMIIMISQYVGKKDINGINSVLLNGLKLCFFAMVFIFVIVFVFPSEFCSIFIESQEIVDIAASYLFIAGIAFLFVPIRLLLNGFIIGTSHSHYIMFVSIVASISEIVLVLFLINYYNVNNFKALAIGTITYVGISIILEVYFYLSKSWIKQINR